MLWFGATLCRSLLLFHFEFSDLSCLAAGLLQPNLQFTSGTASCPPYCSGCLKPKAGRLKGDMKHCMYKQKLTPLSPGLENRHGCNSVCEAGFQKHVLKVFNHVYLLSAQMSRRRFGMLVGLIDLH